MEKEKLTNRHAARAVEEAIASVRLEGLEPSPEAIADMYRMAVGEISIEEVIRRVKERAGIVKASDLNEIELCHLSFDRDD